MGAVFGLGGEGASRDIPTVAATLGCFIRPSLTQTWCPRLGRKEGAGLPADGSGGRGLTSAVLACGRAQGGSARSPGGPTQGIPVP